MRAYTTIEVAAQVVAQVRRDITDRITVRYGNEWVSNTVLTKDDLKRIRYHLDIVIQTYLTAVQSGGEIRLKHKRFVRNRKTWKLEKSV